MKLALTLTLALSSLTVLLAALLQPHPVAVSAADEPSYLSPSELAFSNDGKLLYVVCERSDELRIVDVSSGQVIDRVPVGHVPRNLTVSPDGTRVYVANSWDDTLSEMDAASHKILRTIETGGEPFGVVEDKHGMLYVANRISSDISVIDVESGEEKRRLTAGRGASYLAISHDGGRVYATHVYPASAEHRTAPQSEITVIDTQTEEVIQRNALDRMAGVFHISESADGRLVVAAGMRPKNLVPLAHVEHGWAIGNTVTVFGKDVGEGVILEVPIDELDRYFSLPFGVAIAPDKSHIFISTAGSDSVTVIDTDRLLRFARLQHKPFVNDLSASANYVVARIAVGRNPRGITLSPDGTRLYVANRLDDTLSVIDTVTNQVISLINLGGPPTTNALRRGEQLFHSAKYSFQGQFGCTNCHIDGTLDGLTWDLEPDGLGIDVVDNRMLEDIKDTEPYKWNGGNADIPTECGPRTSKHFYRAQGFSNLQLADLALYIRSMGPRPNRFRSPDGHLTAAQERGQIIFERVTDKRGKPIAQNGQCAFCHSGPKYTSQKSFDVGTGKSIDRSPLFDTPQLTNIALTAPYLHDGSARSLEEIWTLFNPHDAHGVTNDLTKDELNDLIEYLRTL